MMSASPLPGPVVPGDALSRPFVPAPRWTGGHRMTLYTWARPRRFATLPLPTARYFDVAPDARVLAHCYRHGGRVRRPVLIALHGLEGSSSAHYMKGLADKAFAGGLDVLLLNQRNCGGTEHLARGLYHSGLTSDPIAVITTLIEEGAPAIVVVGYSLGGNLALKLAGEYGDAIPPGLRAVCAVSPTMDLAQCVDALERPANRIYQWNFVRNLKRRMRRKARSFPDLYDLRILRGVRTVRQFDDALTAPHHGFRDADDYYFRASALRVVSRIRVPTLVLSAADDPFVPADQFLHPDLRDNPAVRLVVTEHGGHCGFVEAISAGYDGYWAEREAVAFAARHVASPPGVTTRPLEASG